MEYRTLGRTGLRVSPLCLGTMNFGPQTSEGDSHRIMDAALEHGLFGPLQVCAELRRRLGDILILPYRGYFVWWREPGLLVNTFHGHHGGLLPEEVTTVLGAINAL